MTEKLNRYVLVVDLFIHETNDEKAKEVAKSYIDKLQEMADNKASIVSLVEQNWGETENRKL